MLHTEKQEGLVREITCMMLSLHNTTGKLSLCESARYEFQVLKGRFVCRHS